MSGAHPIAIPKLGLTMTDCTLVAWAKNDGDAVARGEALYTIETDKISSDIDADADGFLERIAVVETQLDIGAVIGRLHVSREAALAGSGPAPVATAPSNFGRLRISPLARRIAREAGIDAARLIGTGASGAILKRDVDAAIAEGARPRPSVDGYEIHSPREGGEGVTVAPHVQAAKIPGSPVAKADRPAEKSHRRPLAGIRKAIATRMMQSLHGSAQMTGFGRVDMAEAVRLRKTCLEAEQELGVRITYTDIVLKAAAGVLAAMPEINASIVGDEIVTWDDVSIGLAVALGDGLIVPVIRQADRKSLVEISHARADLAARARSGRLAREDLDGGTFSLSNFGSYGGDFETPILNPPQSALLGIGAITEEPVVRDGQIVIRPMMTISLTFDHRLIDGAVAGKFRGRLKAQLENPGLMMARLR